MAETMKAMWMMVCHITPASVTVVQVRAPDDAPICAAMSSAICVPHSGRPPSSPAPMKVFSRWIELMPMIAMASLTFSTLALTWLSHSG